jgi:hypothetical protein
VVNLAQIDREQIWTQWNQICLSAIDNQKECTQISGVITLDSGQPGIHIGIGGSIHGNEPVGACTLLALWNRHQKQPLLKTGKLSLIFGNPKAFLDNKRFIDQDLNRAFVDQTMQTTEGQRVDELRSFLDQSPLDFLLDLHSISRGDYGIVVYPHECKEEAQKIGCVGMHFRYSTHHMAGRTLIDEIVSRGGKAIVVECGHHHSNRALNVALAHVERLLTYFNLFQGPSLEHSLLPPKQIICYQSEEMIKPGVNFIFTAPVETGSYIPAHHIFAQDQDGPRSHTEEMWLMMPSLHVSPHDSDAGWICSRYTL